MKVVVVPADGHACGHYRMIWPADVLRKQGHDVMIMPAWKDHGLAVKTQLNPVTGKERIIELRIPEGTDVFVLQRPAHPLQPDLVELLRANHIAVVIDMDDDMTCIHPDNSAFWLYRPGSSSPLSWRIASDVCKQATYVTTTTRALQRTYASHGRGQIIDNYVPGTYLKFPSPETGYFGYAGTTLSHPNDPQVTGNATQRLIDDGYKFRQIGGPAGIKRAFKLKEEPDSTGALGLEKWALTIADSIDVGMVPLAPTAFNTAKSRLKGLEYMSLGIPWVASPREEYRRLAKESGGGLLADTPKDWYNKIKLLMDDEVQRKELAEAGRAYMADQTYEKQAYRWLEAWTEALMIERS